MAHLDRLFTCKKAMIFHRKLLSNCWPRHPRNWRVSIITSRRAPKVWKSWGNSHDFYDIMMWYAQCKKKWASYMALSENSVPLNPLLNHHFPYSKYHLGCTPSDRTWHPIHLYPFQGHWDCNKCHVMSRIMASDTSQLSKLGESKFNYQRKVGPSLMA